MADGVQRGRPRAASAAMPAPHVDRVLHVARSRAAAAAQRQKLSFNTQGLVRRIMLPGRAACERDSYFAAQPPSADTAAPAEALGWLAAVAAAAAAAAHTAADALLMRSQRREAEAHARALRDLADARRALRQSHEAEAALRRKASELEQRLADERRARDRAAAGEERDLRRLFSDCYITEFVEIPAAPEPLPPPPPPPEPEPAPPPVVQDRPRSPCRKCGAAEARVQELEHELEAWRVRESEFSAKEDECRRLRTILRFSQLKKDSDRLHQVEHRIFDLELEMDRRAFQTRAWTSQRSELSRLREIEREYEIVRQLWAEGYEPQEAVQKVRAVAAEDGGAAAAEDGAAAPPLAASPTAPPRSNGGAEPPLSSQAAPGGAGGLPADGRVLDLAAAAGVEDKDVSFGTICNRMKSWLKAKEPRQPNPPKGGARAWVGGQWVNVPAGGQQKKRQRVSSAPPGGRRKPQPPPPQSCEAAASFCTPRGRRAVAAEDNVRSAGSAGHPGYWWE